jgi:ABC-type antimicrobial peptide transport system permease subunit
MSQKEGVRFTLDDAFKLGFSYLERRRDRSLLNIASIALGLSFFTTLLLTDTFYQTYTGLNGGNAVIDQSYYWLVVVALAVSVVGITNAMLISVYERVREIGTMKCIGALDQHIIILFFVEAFLQGVVGGIFGIVLGTIGALVTTVSTTGLEIILKVEPIKLLTLYSSSVLIAILLSIIATIYPAYQASKLDPVEALRYEL